MNEEFEELLGRARGHLLRAALESLEATRTLLEAATRATGLQPGEENPLTDNVHHRLIEMIESLRKGGEGGHIQLPEALIRPITIAVELEIVRWETRSKTDPDARAVLRAFLGLRELLWEFGVRSPESGAPSPSGSSSASSSCASPSPSSSSSPAETAGPQTAPQTEPPRKSVQRFDVEE